jgi:peptide/nickel transport system ATP-binding protein
LSELQLREGVAASTDAVAPASTPLLEVQDLHVQFHTSRGIVYAVDGISYTVNPGEVVAIVGESGCGKSVSSLAIMRLLAKPHGRVTKGRVLFQGRDLLKLSDEQMREIRGRDIAMIFQEPMTSLNPVMTRTGSGGCSNIRTSFPAACASA